MLTQNTNPMADAARIGDIFVTATGDKHVLTSQHFSLMKDGAMLCNSGHFDVEIDMAYLNDTAKKIEHEITENVDAYHLSRSIRLPLSRRSTCKAGTAARRRSNIRRPHRKIA